MLCYVWGFMLGIKHPVTQSSHTEYNLTTDHVTISISLNFGMETMIEDNRYIVERSADWYHSSVVLTQIRATCP